MAFSIYTFAASVRNLIHKNNTTTSSLDISSGLESRIKNVTVGYYKNKPVINIAYPHVFVAPLRKNEDYAQLGATLKRKMMIDMQIAGIVQSGIGNLDGRERSDSEMLKLSAKIETLLRNYNTLSNTSEVLNSKITNIEYDAVDYTDTYNSIMRINLQCEVLST